jgi:hypothetical protein
MKHLILLFALILLPVAASAQDGTIEGSDLTWSLSDGTLTISGTGAMPDYNSWDSPWWGMITAVNIEEGVTSIGASAFYYCSYLTAVNIPGSVTKIGEHAFDGCSSLESFTVDGTNTAYSSDNGVLFNKNKTSLIQYPSGNTETVYTIPEGVTTIGEDAFDACSNLETVTIPNSVTTIGESAFGRCSSLTSVTLPSSITTIERLTFKNCESLTTFTIPEGVTTIGESAFEECTNMVSVTIPNSVTTIEGSAFKQCYSLASVTLPESETSIGDAVFLDCRSLINIKVDASNTAYSSLDGALFDKGKTRLVQYPVGKTNASYDIPATVTVIDGYAFFRCKSLASITLPGGVTSIENSAFSGCTALTSVTIPGSVTSIGEYAFNECTALADVTVQWPAPLSIEWSVFGSVNLPSATLHVPAGTKALYEAADVWKDFGTISEPGAPQPPQDPEPTPDVILPQGVSLNESSLTLRVGDTFQLIEEVQPANADNKAVVWTSSNQQVATVAGGLVTAVAPGTATVTVQTVEGGHYASCTVTV